MLCYAMVCRVYVDPRRRWAVVKGQGDFDDGCLFIRDPWVSGTHLSGGCHGQNVSDYIYINLITAFIDRTGHAWQPVWTLCHQWKYDHVFLTIPIMDLATPKIWPPGDNILLLLLYCYTLKLHAGTRGLVMCEAVLLLMVILSYIEIPLICHHLLFFL